MLPDRWSYDAIALWPFILAKKRFRQQGLPASLLRHEMIHWRQQRELLLLPFYFLYVLEWMLKLLVYGRWYKAYRAVSFEREAYRFEHEIGYLKSRRPFAFLRFLKN